MSPIASPEAMLSDANFERFRDYFYTHTGIQFTSAKRYFVDKRVASCVRESGESTFNSWFAAVRLGTRPELSERLINQLTVNETYFLREDYQFNALLTSVLPRVMDDRLGRGRAGPIRIMSLPCSTGEEPYSIALRLLEEWPLMDQVDVEIHAGDIDSAVLAKARKGIYGSRSLQRVPRAWKERHFEHLAEGEYQLNPNIRRAITFSKVNVCDTPQMTSYTNFDIIFCRNVLIYFDALSCRRAAENLYGAMRPGGYLFLGHSESMSRISPIFHPVRLPEGIVYQRPVGAEA
jgi:chemotaxis protein methyltransferase CheR